MWRKMCIYKCMLNVYKNQQNRQTGSRNLMGPKMLPTIWSTYMKVVTKYQISAINSGWEKCDEKCLGQIDRGKTVYPPPPSGSGRIIIQNVLERKDSMAVLPIGFGKSMCYVSPSHFGQGKIIYANHLPWYIAVIVVFSK
jgi:hypothetical protein